MMYQAASNVHPSVVDSLVAIRFDDFNVYLKYKWNDWTDYSQVHISFEERGTNLVASIKIKDVPTCHFDLQIISPPNCFIIILHICKPSPMPFVFNY